jgi:hypothetical protein
MFLLRLRSGRVLAVASMAWFILSSARTVSAADPAPPPKPQTGELTTTFTVRSPPSAPKVLAPRLGLKKLEPDYDLSKEEFLIHVPEDYSPASPPGLLVLLNYKDTAGTPESVLPLFKQRRLIFVTPKGAAQPGWVKVGLALDAVHNLKQRYAVDDARVYLFDFDCSNLNTHAASAGQLLAIAFADVFTGSFHVDSLHPWRSIRSSKGGTYPVEAAPPPPAQAAVAKNHPFVISHGGEEGEYRTLHDQFLRREGFRLLKFKNVTLEQAHYPAYTTDWVTEVLGYLDDNVTKPAAKPQTVPATKPVTVKPATR